MSPRTKTTILPANSLDVDLVDRWNQLQHSNPALDSPFFSSSFTRAVADERGGAEVAVIQAGETVVGFLPYCRQRGNIGAPIAGSFTDFQGLIAAPNTPFDMRRILRHSRLSAWQFDRLVMGNDSLNPYLWAISASPFMDLSRGFEAYRESCRDGGRKEIAEAFRRAHQLDREVAPVQFELETKNWRILDTLIEWKQQQLRQQRRPDCFRAEWVVPFLNRVLHTRGETFRAMLSVLHVGDELGAITFGLRSGPVLHSWITASNPKFRKFSPGLMLIISLAENAESQGISRIDLGRGDESFKRSLCTAATRVAEGAVDRRLVAGAMKHSWVLAKKALQGAPLQLAGQRL